MLELERTVEAPNAQDSWHGKFEWRVEKWSDEAVNFVQRKLAKNDIRVVQSGVITRNEPIYAKDEGTGLMVPIGEREVMVGPKYIPISEGIPSWLLREMVGEAEEEIEVLGNLLLNEGIAQVEDLTMIATVLTNQTAANAWGSTNAFTGVGDSATAEAATQTDLQAATNHFYKGMNATFPSRSSQTVSFQSDFTTAEANYVWNEWTIAAGATSASGSGFLLGTKNLNRKVASLGTKASGTWTLTGQVTLS